MGSLIETLLWQRTRVYLRRYQPTLVGIAGSSEVALVKVALERALGSQQRVRAAADSSTSRQAVAHAILGMERLQPARPWLRVLTGSRIREWAQDEPNTIIVELPLTKPGDIDFYARTLPFRVGIVTTAHSGRLDLFSRPELVAHELASLVINLPQEGVAIFNADDQRFAEAASRRRAATIRYGVSTAAEVRLTRHSRRPAGGLIAEFRVRGVPYELHLVHLIAERQLHAIAAVLAAAAALKIDVRRAVPALQTVMPPPGQLRQLPGAHGARLLDDSADATYEQVLDDMRLLADLPVGIAQPRRRPGLVGVSQPARGRRIAILGDIDGLALQTVSAHHAIGRQVAEQADVFIAVGQHMRLAGAAALEAAQESSRLLDVHRFDNSADVGKWLRDFLTAGDVVLIAGSASQRLEEATARLLADPHGDRHHLVQRS